jgi:hypothetical protein
MANVCDYCSRGGRMDQCAFPECKLWVHSGCRRRAVHSYGPGKCSQHAKECTTCPNQALQEDTCSHCHAYLCMDCLVQANPCTGLVPCSSACATLVVREIEAVLPPALAMMVVSELGWGVGDF